MKNKRRQLGALLIAILLVSLVFVPSVAVGDTREKDPEKFVDPVTVKVREMKAKGMSDDEIVKALEASGMGYYPPTGATWIGTRPTPEEMQKLPPRKYPFKDVAPSEVPSAGTLSYQANQVMETTSFSYSGFKNYLKPGTLAIKTGESTLHLVTSHIGAGGHWTEGGVMRWEVRPWLEKFSYDDDEGGWVYHGSTSATTFTKYEIRVIYNDPPYGYYYSITIDGNWVRSGHLPYMYNNQVDQTNEVWSNTNIWTPDDIVAEHKEPYLMYGLGYIKWDSSVGTNWYGAPNPCPVKEYHYIDGSGTWRYLTWVG